MFNIVFRLVWNFLILILNIWHFILGMISMLESHLISTGLIEKYKVLNLNKLRYLAIVVESEEAQDTSSIVTLLRWLSIIGVKRLCLYDMDGVLKKSKEIILEELGDARLWKLEADEKDSFLDQKKMTLEFSSFSDSKEGVAKAANFLCLKNLEDSSLAGVHDEPVFTEANMSKAVRAVGFDAPDPDLLLIFGPMRCHLGFPAWRMRYTEIVHMGPLKSMNYGSVVKAIHKFTYVKQNYGS